MESHIFGNLYYDRSSTVNHLRIADGINTYLYKKVKLEPYFKAETKINSK